MTATLIGYASCSTDAQDLTAQRQALASLGVAEDRIYLDKGLPANNSVEVDGSFFAAGRTSGERRPSCSSTGPKLDSVGDLVVVEVSC